MIFQVDLKFKYKFRLILEESVSYGILGRHGRGLTEHLHVDPTLVDMIVGSLAGPLCAGGGFCAGSADVVDHQRISSAAYTYSAALPAMLATTASETLTLLEEEPGLITSLQENIRAFRGQIDPRSDWVRITSCVENPMQILVFKPEVLETRGWGLPEQDEIFQDVVDEVRASGPLCYDVAISLTSRPPWTDTREWCDGDTSQGDASGAWSLDEESRMAAPICPQGVYHYWIDPERS